MSSSSRGSSQQSSPRGGGGGQQQQQQKQPQKQQQILPRKKDSSSSQKNYNQHWLIQEAEQRRIAEMQQRGTQYQVGVGLNFVFDLYGGRNVKGETLIHLDTRLKSTSYSLY